MTERSIALGPRVALLRSTDDRGRLVSLECVVDGERSGPFLRVDAEASTGHCDARPPGPVRQEFAAGVLRTPNMFGDDDHPQAADYDSWVRSCQSEVESFALDAALDAAAKDALDARPDDAAAAYDAVAAFAPELAERVDGLRAHYLGEAGGEGALGWRESVGLPNYAGKWHRLAVSPKGVVLCTGGMQGETYTGQGKPCANVAEWDPVQGRWHARPALPTATAYHATVWLNDDELMVFGGATEDYHDLRVSCYSVSASRWRGLAPLPGSRSAPAAIRLRDGRVFVAGGDKKTALYDPASDRWSEGPALRYKESWPVVVQVDAERVAVLTKTDHYYVDFERGEVTTAAIAEHFHRLVTTEHFALWPMSAVAATRPHGSDDIVLLCRAQDPKGEPRASERVVTARWKPGVGTFEWQPAVIRLGADNLPSTAALDDAGTALVVAVQKGGECVTQLLPWGAREPLTLAGPFGHYRAQTLSIAAMPDRTFLAADGKSTLRLAADGGSG